MPQIKGTNPSGV